MGYPYLAKLITSNPNLLLVAQYLQIYDAVLSSVPHGAIGGIESWNMIEVTAAKKIGIDSRQAFPLDIGKLLIKKFELASVQDYGFEQVIEITNSTSKARRALFELDKAVELVQKEEIMERSLALEQSWNETNEIVESMHNIKNKATKYVPTSIGVVGSILSSFNLPGILATIFAIAGSFQYAAPIAEYLVKIKKPNHIVAVYDMS
jgi:hypothetical protein